MATAPVIPQHVLVAPDAFKGTLRATEVAAAVGSGLEAAGLPPADLCPVADGGEGTIEVLLPRLGGEIVGGRARSPLGHGRRAGFALLEGGATALVEVAVVGGMGIDDPDPLHATTHGTGDLVAAAVDAGAAVVLVAAGGSATVDGGAGAIAAIEEAGGLRGARLVVLCDVRTPWERAAERFGPQKGADAAAVRELAARLDAQARMLPRDPRGVPGGGAAGGLAGGLWAAFGAVLEPGAPWILGALGFDARMRAARAVLIGEGRLDSTSLEGKCTGEIATRARQAGVPCAAIVGQNDLTALEARMLDLQVVAEAVDVAGLERAAADVAGALGLLPGRRG